MNTQSSSWIAPGTALGIFVSPAAPVVTLLKNDNRGFTDRFNCFSRLLSTCTGGWVCKRDTGGDTGAEVAA